MSIKVRVKAWDKIIDYETKRVHDDKGLYALDALQYGPIHEIDEFTPDIERALIEEYIQTHPDTHFDMYEVEIVSEN